MYAIRSYYGLLEDVEHLIRGGRAVGLPVQGYEAQATRGRVAQDLFQQGFEPAFVSRLGEDGDGGARPSCE